MRVRICPKVLHGHSSVCFSRWAVGSVQGGAGSSPSLQNRALGGAAGTCDALMSGRGGGWGVAPRAPNPARPTSVPS